MYKALYYKEWAKTKRILLLTGALFAGMLIYTFIHNGQLFRIHGAVSTWGNVLLKDMTLLPSGFEWLPLLAALLLGVSQFVPEITDKRLKLTLHLPLSETKIISAVLFYGLMILTLLFVVSYIVLIVGLGIWYPQEMISNLILRSLPWFIAGYTAYLFTAWICLEPVWKQRIFNALISLFVLSFYYIAARSGTYLYFLPWLMLIAVIAFTFPFYSTARFKDGAQ